METQRIVTRLLPSLEVKTRRPKRSTEAALHALSGWLPTVTKEDLLPDPQHPDKRDQSTWSQPLSLFTVRYVRKVTQYLHGWCQVTDDQVRPLPPTWKTTKTLKPLLTADAGGRPILTATSVNGKRIWAGQCEKCKKHTLGLSTYFLQYGRCLHCEVKKPPTAPGTNLFLAGNYPLGEHLFLVTADTIERAQTVAQAEGHAWVIPLYASRRGRKIPLPVPESQPRRPVGAWPFKIDDVPEGWERTDDPTWQDENGLETAWHKPWFSTPEPTQEAPAPEAPTVSFDDFM